MGIGVSWGSGPLGISDLLVNKLALRYKKVLIKAGAREIIRLGTKGDEMVRCEGKRTKVPEWPGEQDILQKHQGVFNLLGDFTSIQILCYKYMIKLPITVVTKDLEFID